MAHKFKVGDKVVYTNDFGVCWGVKTITSLETRSYDMWGETVVKPCYHYDGSDTPWFAVDERNFTLATKLDIMMDGWWIGAWEYFQAAYGFKPTAEQLGGCG